MTSNTRFKVNAPTVTHETIDGESVVINLVTGNYFSLQGTGAEIWALLAQNATPEEISADISRHYTGSSTHIEESVLQLLLELQSEQLIVPDERSATRQPTDFSLIAATLDRPQFQAPQLQKFTDMQELLLLDPIHEVDAAGWPSVKQDA